MERLEPVVVVLDEVLGTASAGLLRDRLLELRGQDVTLDVSHVRHLGGLCAQVMVAASASWREAGGKLALCGAGETFLSAAQTLGLTHHLSCEA